MMSYSVSLTVSPPAESLYRRRTAGRLSTMPVVAATIVAPLPSRKFFLADFSWATVTGTTPPCPAAPTKPAGGLLPRVTYWKPDDGGLLVHCDGTITVAPTK